MIIFLNYFSTILLQNWFKNEFRGLARFEISGQLMKLECIAQINSLICLLNILKATCKVS